MHEFSLMADLMKKIQLVAAQERASRVRSVTVQLGPLCHISADHFREHFEQAAKGTIVEGAQLHVELLSDPQHPQAQDILLRTLELES